MADTLLPGLTNATRRVRYYSVIAWMYHHARTRHHLYVLEAAFIHAVRRHKHVSGRHETIGAQVLPAEATGGRLRLVMDDRKVPSVLDPAYYGPSAYALGIAGDADGEPTVTREARDLARCLGLDGSALPGPSERTIPTSLVESLGALCFCQPVAGEEQRRLEELLFRMETRRVDAELTGDGPRRRTLALLLDVVRPDDENERVILQRVLDWALRRDGYNPPGPLLEEAYGLALLTLRWYVRKALESVWAAFGRMLRTPFEGTSVRPYVDLVVAEARGADAWCPHRNGTLGEIVDGLGADPGLEYRGAHLIAAHLDVSPARSALYAAMLLAKLAEQVPKLDDRKRYYVEFLDLGSPYWVPLRAFASRYGRVTSLRDWVTHLFERYAIAQHQLTAARKLGQGVDGFYFQPTERGLRLTPATRGPWGADGGPTKVTSALTLLEGLGHIVETERGWAPTARGAEICEAVVADPGTRT